MGGKLLVTGASGHFGQAAVRHLLDSLNIPGEQIIATTRKPDQLAAFAERGVHVRAADFDDPSTLTAAFDGSKRLLLVSTDSFDRPGARVTQHEKAIRAAENAGVEHIIYTSMPNPDGSPILVAPDHLQTEKLLEGSTISGWTILRNNWYFEAVPMAFAPALASGQLFTATGSGRTAFISREDLALAAATVLAGNDNAKRIYTLSGSEALSNDDLAAAIGSALDRPIQVIQVPVDALVEGMKSFGLPEPLAKILASFDLHTAEGRVAGVTGDFSEITGRQPTRFADWLAANKNVFAPPPG